YEESMASNCGGSQVTYQKGHNPAFWYTDLRTPVNYCSSNDVPLTQFDPASLPALSWVTPNQCHNMHYQSGCPGTEATRITAGDTWLSTFLPPLLSSPNYLNGNTLIVLTWDEGEGPSRAREDCSHPTTYTLHPLLRHPHGRDVGVHPAWRHRRLRPEPLHPRRHCPGHPGATAHQRICDSSRVPTTRTGLLTQQEQKP
ncbi:alkaline phosphatase family protein, partial [Lapillicoccus sp.]|uniref:alkaline phosphatase family protein n=1 Tax=Lapillicoccus sp. TaxID=1909287 RepID=UPI003266D2DE